MHIPREWIFKQLNHALIHEITERLNIGRVAATVLVNRGISSLEEAKAFLAPELDETFNPFLLPDMGKAVGRIRRAIDTKEKILVYGDRDVDGITSISVMVRTLRSLGADPKWYIPSEEGYGVHNEIIERFAGEGIQLIVTVDCGISAVEQTEYARTRGIDMVITDHHEPPVTGIPGAAAVVDPKRVDSRYPFSELAGCTVSFKVAEALMLSFGKYFDQELVFLYAVPRDYGYNITAIKVKNDLPGEEFSATVRDRESTEPFLRFIGDRRLVIHPARGGSDFFDTFLRARCALAVSNEVIDISTLASSDAVDKDMAGAVPDSVLSLFRMFRAVNGCSDMRMRFFRENHLDVVTLGTIADIMPLVNENRVLVKKGLGYFPQSRKVGIQVLINRCLNKNKSNGISSKAVSWNITPLLNSAGRLGKADLSAELLLTESGSQAEKLFEEIVKLNSERKELQSENLEKFIPLLCEQCDLDHDRIFLVTATGIEHGVTGIIASQIMRQYHRPTVLLIVEGEEAMGAARSIEGFDIVGALGSMSDLLIKYGGHSQAAGLTIRADRLDEFRVRLKAIAEERIRPEMLIPKLEIDAELEAQDISLSLINELSGLEPYGMGNPYPVFSLRKVKVREHGRVGNNGSHLKLRLSKNGGSMLSAIGWGLGPMEDDIARYSFVDVAVQVEVNVWQDRESVQLLIMDIKPSEL